jgi:hypothetical protein
VYYDVDEITAKGGTWLHGQAGQGARELQPKTYLIEDNLLICLRDGDDN